MVLFDVDTHLKSLRNKNNILNDYYFLNSNMEVKTVWMFKFTNNMNFSDFLGHVVPQNSEDLLNNL